jgi:signal transduction histidine kinase/ligand-binding sensor domain-containing protein
MGYLGERRSSSAGLRGQIVKVVMLMVFGCISVRAEQPSPLSIHSLYHNRWTVREGVPSNIRTIAQAADGYLWIGTDHGLFRFDGVHFSPYQPQRSGTVLSQDIAVITALDSDGLWIGYEHGGASFLKDGHLTNYTLQDGLSQGSVRSFAKGSDGTMWAATEYGIVRFDGSRWHELDLPTKSTGSYPNSIFIDSRGTLWANTGGGLLYLPLGQQTLITASATTLQNADFSEASDGRVWVASTRASIRAITNAKGAYVNNGTGLPYKSEGIYIDPQDHLWISLVGKGLARLDLRGDLKTHDPSLTFAEELTERDGLSGNFSFQVTGGREGSTWVASTKGLDQFRDSPFVPIPLPNETTYVSIVMDRSGSLLIGADHLLSVKNGIAIPLTAGPSHIECAYRDPDGNVWLGGQSKLWEMSGSHFIQHPLPKEASGPFRAVQAITMDHDHGLWVSIIGVGVFRLSKGVWERSGGLRGLPEEAALSTFIGKGGRIWLGYSRNRIVTIDQGLVTLLTASTGLDLDNAIAFMENSTAVWIGGSAGLQYFQNGRFHDADVDTRGRLSGVSGLVNGVNGDLWLNTIGGVLRIPGSDVSQLLGGSKASVHAESFDYLDGLTGTPEQLRPLPTAIRGLGDALYFATRGGVASIEAGSRVRNSLPPPVWIEAVIADGKGYVPPKHLTMPAGTRELTINYTATSLLIPERVQFRYKLVGFDNSWREAGTQRQAFYSRLPPGKYRFQVLASNNDGVWNTTGAELSFSITPSFVQTLFFKLLCGTLLIGAAWFIYLIRLKQITTRLNARMQERVTERERIARDLHDTFLQGIQAVLLTVHTANRLIEANSRPRRMIEDALSQSDQVLLEGRDLVMQLRGKRSECTNLSSALQIVGAELSKSYPAQFNLSVLGEHRDLDPVIRDDVYGIGREAVSNSFRHSKATHINVELIYGTEDLTLHIRDDGIGINSQVLEAGQRSGHWGLPGIKERAKKIGALYLLQSEQTVGTAISLSLPAAIAYLVPEKPIPAFSLSRLWKGIGENVE